MDPCPTVHFRAKESNIVIIQVISVSSVRMYYFTPEMKVAHLYDLGYKIVWIISDH